MSNLTLIARVLTPNILKRDLIKRNQTFHLDHNTGLKAVTLAQPGLPLPLQVTAEQALLARECNLFKGGQASPSTEKNVFHTLKLHVPHELQRSMHLWICRP